MPHAKILLVSILRQNNGTVIKFDTKSCFQLKQLKHAF